MVAQNKSDEFEDDTRDSEDNNWQCYDKIVMCTLW